MAPAAIVIQKWRQARGANKKSESHVGYRSAGLEKYLKIDNN